MHIFGIVILAAGVALLLFGWRSSQAFKEKVVKGFTGHFTRRTMLYLIGGIALIVVGGALIFYGGR